MNQFLCTVTVIAALGLTVGGTGTTDTGMNILVTHEVPGFEHGVIKHDHRNQSCGTHSQIGRWGNHGMHQRHNKINAESLENMMWLFLYLGRTDGNR